MNLECISCCGEGIIASLESEAPADLICELCSGEGKFEQPIVCSSCSEPISGLDDYLLDSEIIAEIAIFEVCDICKSSRTRLVQPMTGQQSQIKFFSPNISYTSSGNNFNIGDVVVSNSTATSETTTI